VKTEVLSSTSDGALPHAVELLRQKEVVALPTETVYGLAADALSEEAVLRIFQAKSRPRFDPLIVHLPDSNWIDQVAIVDSNMRLQFDRLRKQFWPGPLTFVFPRQTQISDVVTAGLEPVAVRLSSHPVFQKIISAFGRPLAAPSANRFGRISPTAAAHVLEELDGLIPLVVDGGPTAHGLESTIVALRNDRIEVLRRGPITEEQLSEFCHVVVVDDPHRPEAPGQLPSHYAPRTRVILVEDASSYEVDASKRCGLLSWKSPKNSRFIEVRMLSERQDLATAAANLFRFLRELDTCDLDLIVAEKVPEEGLGAAINDRLSRASRA
jgi:L-threonylcarbamoyladenylate synthase